MQSPRVYFNNIGSICTDSLRHGNGLSALLLLTRAAKSSAAKSSAAKTRSMENGLYFSVSEICVSVSLTGKFIPIIIDRLFVLFTCLCRGLRVSLLRKPMDN